MPINYKKTVAVLDGHCQIEEAEVLLEWLLEHPKAKLNLKGCTQIHTAVLQVLMASAAVISIWPEDALISAWLKPILEQ